MLVAEFGHGVAHLAGQHFVTGGLGRLGGDFSSGLFVDRHLVDQGLGAGQVFYSQIGPHLDRFGVGGDAAMNGSLADQVLCLVLILGLGFIFGLFLVFLFGLILVLHLLFQIGMLLFQVLMLFLQVVELGLMVLHLALGVCHLVFEILALLLEFGFLVHDAGQNFNNGVGGCLKIGRAHV